MKISELIALLEQRKEEYGDVKLSEDAYCDMYDLTRVTISPSLDNDILIL